MTGTTVSNRTGRTIPLVGATYTDARERKLAVTAVDEGARDGREVIGRRQHGYQPVRPYSTTIETWLAVWRDKVPPADPRKMKVGG